MRNAFETQCSWWEEKGSIENCEHHEVKQTRKKSRKAGNDTRPATEAMNDTKAIVQENE